MIREADKARKQSLQIPATELSFSKSCTESYENFLFHMILTPGKPQASTKSFLLNCSLKPYCHRVKYEAIYSNSAVSCTFIFFHIINFILYIFCLSSILNPALFYTTCVSLYLFFLCPLKSTWNKQHDLGFICWVIIREDHSEMVFIHILAAVCFISDHLPVI